MADMMSAEVTVPGISLDDGTRVAELLQGRLDALNDLALTLKHVHWNVVGPHFVAVHQMLDPQVEKVRAMVDETAERIATLGSSPRGTAGALVAGRDTEEYPLRRADTQDHLAALDSYYSTVLRGHRVALEQVEAVDLVTQDLLIGQTRDLELFQWFVRAHLENAGGRLRTP